MMKKFAFAMIAKRETSDQVEVGVEPTLVESDESVQAFVTGMTRAMITFPPDEGWEQHTILCGSDSQANSANITIKRGSR